MGYIICDIHGGNVVSLVSKHHADKIMRREEAFKPDIRYIHVSDIDQLLDGRYLVDPYLVNRVGIVESKIESNRSCR